VVQDLTKSLEKFHQESFEFWLDANSIRLIECHDTEIGVGASVFSPPLSLRYSPKEVKGDIANEEEKGFTLPMEGDGSPLRKKPSIELKKDSFFPK